MNELIRLGSTSSDNHESNKLFSSRVDNMREGSLRSKSGTARYSELERFPS